MKDVDGRKRLRILPWGSGLRPVPMMTVANRDEKPGGASAAVKGVSESGLQASLGASALAFRGYDQTNMGRSAELLRHRDYGPIVARILAEASAICCDSVHRRVDLEEYVRNETPSSLDTFPEDVAMIVGMELAQVRILEEVFQVPVRQAKLSLGYSIGELSAIVVGGTLRLEQILPVPLSLAEDCASLARDTTMGVLFTRRDPLEAEAVERLCEAVRGEGQGLIGPSAYLSPNTALVLGQGRTLDLLERAMGDFLPEKTMLRRKEHRWPPLHSPLVWAHNIPNRAAMAMYRIGGALAPPEPPVVSCVTGGATYDGHNCRETLIQWTDRPQRLWDVIDNTLSAGVETVIHIGPGPNLIPATFSRLSNNIAKQLGHGALHALGRGMVASMNRHTWLSHLLPSRAALLRAPFLTHVLLEDWLLEQRPD